GSRPPRPMLRFPTASERERDGSCCARRRVRKELEQKFIAGGDRSMLPDNTVQTRSSYPIAFQLYDETGDEVLTISDSGGQREQLVIRTTARDAIKVQPKGTKAAANNYHFALAFRKGTLASNAIGRAAPETSRS